MFRNALFYLSCLVILSILTRTEAEILTIIRPVPHPDWQCQLVGHSGSCHNTNLPTRDSFDCMNVKCIPKYVKWRPSDLKYPSVSIGKALDGTQCDGHSVCLKGICTELDKGQLVPEQYNRQTTERICY